MEFSYSKNEISHIVKIVLYIFNLILFVSCSGEMQITQPNENSVFYDGKTYTIITIGEQVWLRENLNVGSMITSSAIEDDQQDNFIIEKYCYDNDPANCEKYGGLYQWDEVMMYQKIEGSKGICPEGFHIPTFAEFEILSNFVNNEAKYLVDTNENSALYEPTNIHNFDGLFGGYRGTNGKFYDLGLGGYYFSSSEDNEGYAFSLSLISSYPEIYLYGRNKKYGICIKCIKD